jgi:Thioesterase-like superfamily
MAENTISTSAPFTRFVPHGGDKRRWTLRAISALLVYIRTILRQTSAWRKSSNARRRERERRKCGGSDWTQPTAKSVMACFAPGKLTRGPWHPDHQHAGPPSALICRAIERVAAKDGLTHLGRLTVNLLRPAPIGECRVAVAADYIGRNAGHFSGRLTAEDKDVARFTALMQREEDSSIPTGTQGHPPPQAPRPPDQSPVVEIPVAGLRSGYGTLVENRIAAGRFFNGPSAAWFRMNHPLIEGEHPSPYQRVAVAGDSGNGVSASLDFAKYMFINCDLTLNIFRRPEGEWICLEARSLFGGNGCGLAESALYDEKGLIGRATQSLAIRLR